MYYSYYDLGKEPENRRAVLRLRGTAANVILLDPLNFHRYRSGQSFFYTGGYSRRSPVRLEIPPDVHWYLVIDHGGYAGRVQAELEVLTEDELGSASQRETTPVEAVA